MKSKVNYQDRWIDENGKPVDIYIFFGATFYVDEQARRLTYNYDLKTCPNSTLNSSLGKYQYEEDAMDILQLCRLMRSVIGMTAEDWETYKIIVNNINCWQKSSLYLQLNEPLFR